MSVGPFPSVRTVLVWRAGVAAGVRVAGIAMVVAGVTWFMGILSTVFVVRPLNTHEWPGWDRRYAATGGDNITIANMAAYNRAAGWSFGLGLTGLGLIAGAGGVARLAVPLRRPRARCPVCRYSTVDLAAPRCPECGVDLPAELVQGPPAGRSDGTTARG